MYEVTIQEHAHRGYIKERKKIHSEESVAEIKPPSEV
jgi:hypothetical protein